MTLDNTFESGLPLLREPVSLRRASRFVGNGHFQQFVVQQAVEASSEVPGSTGMADGCQQRFSRNSTVETRLKHGDFSC